MAHMRVKINIQYKETLKEFFFRERERELIITSPSVLLK